MREPVRCAHCSGAFTPDPRVKKQRYCSNKLCQRARKRLWQKQKLAADPDYKQNQRDSQQRWCIQNRRYWRDYRRNHGDYTHRNRMLQKARDRRRCLKKNLAKMDASKPIYSIKQGTYYLIPERAGLAKMDAFAQKVCLIPAAYP